MQFFLTIKGALSDGVHFLIDLKTRAVAPFFPDARTFHNIYKLQKHALLRHQSVFGLLTDFVCSDLFKGALSAKIVNFCYP
jgi:hypothetical protein